MAGMTEDPTRQYDTPDPSASYDWDFEDDEKPRGEGPRLLWGRIVALLVALLLVFFLGRATVSTDSSGAEAEDLREQVAELQSELDALRSQQATEASEEPENSPAPSESAAAGGEETEADAETYVVRPGDTLNTIAEDQYGDVGLGDELGEANGITDPEQLRVGVELEIPADL
jgi:LysM repeat protein